MKDKLLTLIFFGIGVFFLVLMVIRADAYISTGNPGDTAAGTVITAASSECTLDYKDTGGVAKTTVKPPTDISVAVAAEYGFSGIGTPADQKSRGSGNPVYYSYIITNEGNTSDTYNAVVYPSDITLEGATRSWTVQVVSDVDDSAPDLTIAEDGTMGFRVKVTPAASAEDGQRLQYTVSVWTNSTPVGQYTGANGLTYGGNYGLNDTTITSIEGAPKMSITSSYIINAPTNYRGSSTAPVPGAVANYTYTYSNIGSGTAENIAFGWTYQYSYSQNMSHINASSAEVNNVVLTAPKSTAVGWRVYTSEAGTQPSFAYGNYTNWTWIGTIGATTDYATVLAGHGNFPGGVSFNTRWLKFEKSSIPPTEDNRTIMFGTTIR